MRTTSRTDRHRRADVDSTLSTVTRLALAILVGAALPACRELDPAAPASPHREIPKPIRTLSSYLSVSNPVDVNGAGEVLGSMVVGSASHAAISINGAAYDLGTMDGSAGTSTYPSALNAGGKVVGIQFDSTGNARGFAWAPDAPDGTTGRMQPVPDGPGGAAQPVDINDAGQMVGNYLSTGTGIVLWGCGGVVDIPSPISGGTTYPAALNNYGQIVGAVHDGSGSAHAFLWTPSAPNGCDGSSVLLEPPGSAGSYAVGLNAFGQVVLNDTTGKATLWTPATANGSSGAFAPLLGPYGALDAVRINSRGDVLAAGPGPGSSICGATTHVFLWRPKAPNGATGGTLDFTPTFGADDYWDPTCRASPAAIGDEENGTIQAFGQDMDAYGNVYDDMWTLTNVDAPLAASISWTGTPDEGYVLSFDARGTTPFSPTLAFQWDFGDGGSATGSTASHMYVDNGQYTVRLTASDGTGGVSTATTTITVNNLPPSGLFSAAPTQLAEGGSYVIGVSRVTDSPADLPTLQLALDCGDGRGYQAAAVGSSLTCPAPNDGTRTARAQLRDKDGGLSEYSAVVTISDVAPSVMIVNAPTSISEQTTYTVSFTFTDPGLLDSWQYVINWGDGTATAPASVTVQGNTLTASHQYQIVKRGGVKSATYNVTVSVSDNAGLIGTAFTSVLVTAMGGGTK